MYQSSRDCIMNCIATIDCFLYPNIRDNWEGEIKMAKPVSISLNKFTASVQAAVKSAVAKHPKFNVPTPRARRGRPARSCRSGDTSSSAFRHPPRSSSSRPRLGSTMSKLCPSAQPGMDRAMVLGVVQQDGPRPVVEYLNARVPATPEILALAAPLKP